MTDPSTTCNRCGRSLSLGDEWWHRRWGNETDLCGEHWAALPDKLQNRFSLVACAQDLGDVAHVYCSRGKHRWWDGCGSKVAILIGGGFYERGDRPIQACEGDCVDGVFDALTAAHFEVSLVDIGEVGEDGPGGDSARLILEGCQCVLVPGGHDIPQAAALGPIGKAALQAVLGRGGGLVGVCAGAWLLCEGDKSSHNGHCYGWLPVSCHCRFADNGLVGIARLSSSPEGENIFGVGLSGQVWFDESPLFVLDDRAVESGVKIDATFDAPGVQLVTPFDGEAAEKIGPETISQLVGEAAVVRGTPSVAQTGRIVLLSTHFELTSGPEKGEVLARAVAWALGRDPW